MHQIRGEGPRILIISYFTAAVNSCYSLITRLRELWTLFVVNFAQENWVFTTILAEMLIITIMIKRWGLETAAGVNLETRGCQLVWLCWKICHKESGLELIHLLGKVEGEQRWGRRWAHSKKSASPLWDRMTPFSYLLFRIIVWGSWN